MSRELGNKLTMLRSGMGFTQNQIAAQINVDRSTYSNYERAVTEPDTNTLKKLAMIFKVSVDFLLSNDEKTVKVAEHSSIPIYTLSKDEKLIIARYRVLNEEQKQKTADFMKNFLIIEE